MLTAILVKMYSSVYSPIGIVKDVLVSTGCWFLENVRGLVDRLLRSSKSLLVLRIVEQRLVSWERRSNVYRN